MKLEYKKGFDNEVPKEIYHMLKYTRSIKFNKRPDYKYLKKLL